MRRLFKRMIPLIALCPIFSCSDSGTGPDNNSESGGDNSGSDGTGSTTGTVEITTSTSGNNQDSDGYTVTIGGSEKSISAKGTVTFDMEEGSYDAELTGITSNCSTDGDNPKSVGVTAELAVAGIFI